MSNLVTIDQVLNWTGSTVTDAQITMAQSYIGMICQRNLDDSKLNDSSTSGEGNYISLLDQTYVNFAIAYQCVWMAAQPDLFTRIGGITNLTQDGLTMATNDPQAWVLSPVAKKSLMRCGFLRSRTLRPVTDFQRGSNQPGLQDYEDDDLAWSSGGM
jgi:hypothetical protein